MSTDKPLEMSEEQYHQLQASYSGVCSKCNAVRLGDTEPDAENYSCTECGEDAVFGIEMALLMELVTISEDDNEELPL